MHILKKGRNTIATLYIVITSSAIFHSYDVQHMYLFFTLVPPLVLLDSRAVYHLSVSVAPPSTVEAEPAFPSAVAELSHLGKRGSCWCDTVQREENSGPCLLGSLQMEETLGRGDFCDAWCSELLSSSHCGSVN